MNIGFTGTREGMTELQSRAVRKILNRHSYRSLEKRGTFHNGLAIGADEQAAKIARELRWIVVGYPSDRADHTCDFIPDRYAQEPKPPLKRNPDIVRASELMIATPSGFIEVVRSGTWATIREARDRQGKPIVIVWPDGSESWYN